ncbi:MAG: protein kinase [Chlamydiota bacterium]
MHDFSYYGMNFVRGLGIMGKNQDAETLPKAIGPYVVIQSLGKGGMGEVFLAKDPSCGRLVALKRIRAELRNNKTIQNRFLREARVASLLTHPSIVPILSIQTTPPEIYYTMPFVEGDTLRQILRTAREQEKNGECIHPIGRSIPALARIFLQVCEAIAYTHSKGILHRDVKPENIIVGKYGEVMILDWGIADFIDQIEKEDPLPAIKKIANGEELTRPGKITGTLAYMAPERLTGKSSSVQTDIYALGVILYQMLTLQLPFQRKTIAAFRKQAHSEELVDPIEMAPYRDIPHQLAEVSHKCLAHSEKERYRSVEELIAELKNYIEGRPEWVFRAELDRNRKEDWQFQENLLLAKHIAITRSLDVTEWAALMISKGSFANNIRIDAEVRLSSHGQGLGFLFSVPEADERKSLEEGYCLWIGSASHPTCQLFRNNVQVLEVKTLFLESNIWHRIRIEKVDDYLKFFLNGVLKVSFGSHLPLAGTHVGLLHKDADFELKHFKVYDGSHNVMVGCLAVPNAFLTYKLYDLALQEYRRIGLCFPGRMEGREALFRAGLTLLEEARAEKGKAAKEKLFHLALKEFEKLYRTPGAPLEYLGKSLVYDALGDAEEEAKCLELALRKFPKHPLLPMLKERIVYRIHESSLNHREAAYRIILLAIRHIPNLLENGDTRYLLESLEKNWEQLPFLEDAKDRSSQIAIQLAFWLAKIPILVEIGQNLKALEPVDEKLLGNALFCLLELEAFEELNEFGSLHPLKVISLSQPFPSQLDKKKGRSIYYFMRKALKDSEYALIESTFLKLKKCKMDPLERTFFDALEIWSHLLQKKLPLAKELFDQYPASLLNQETSPLHFPYGTWLYLSKGRDAAMHHFSSVLDTPYPPTTALPSYFLTGRIDDKKGWIEHAFWWEKKELHRQIDLFYRCVGKT